MAERLRVPALDPAGVEEKRGTGYPAPFRALVAGRARKVLGDALGLTQFGVNLVRLEPGAASAQRHWHVREDEFVMVLKGELTLVTDAGEQILIPGDVAGFAAGVADGHHLVNRSGEDAEYLEVGTRVEGETAHYPDIDLVYLGESQSFTRKNGDKY
jgi:uncharacterized cupin superfamily protein